MEKLENFIDTDVNYFLELPDGKVEYYSDITEYLESIERYIKENEDYMS